MKFISHQIFLLLFVFFKQLNQVFCFVPAEKTSFVVPVAMKKEVERRCLSLFAKQHPEFSVLDGDEEVFNDPEVKSPTYDVVAWTKNLDESKEPSTEKLNPEYGALSPGTVVQVQIGDLSLARKAWKKRRRTGSPLLVPCSVLNVDRQSMVRWNLIHLLEKFGVSRNDGISITVSEMSKYYRNFLKSSLTVCFCFWKLARALFIYKKALALISNFTF